MVNSPNYSREIPKHDIHVKASMEERSFIKELGTTAMEEYIVPKSKEAMRDLSSSLINMFSDALKAMFEKILYPDGNVPNRKTSSSSGYYSTNYTSYSRPINSYQQSQRNQNAIGQRPGNAVKYIWVEKEDDARRIIGALKEDIIHYGKAKVATLYEMTGERTTMADFQYGWIDENAIGYYEDTNRAPGEFRWFIDLPKPVDIRGT